MCVCECVRVCEWAIPSLSKLRARKGAQSESKPTKSHDNHTLSHPHTPIPCQYTKFRCETTHDLSTLLNLLWPSSEASRGWYWWQRGMSTSICLSVGVTLSLSIHWYLRPTSPYRETMDTVFLNWFELSSQFLVTNLTYFNQWLFVPFFLSFNASSDDTFTVRLSTELWEPITCV